MLSRLLLEDALSRVGERLHAEALSVRVVVVGGAAADGQHPRHERDLIMLAPTDDELAIAIAESHRTNNETLWPFVERVAERLRAARHG